MIPWRILAGGGAVLGLIASSYWLGHKAGSDAVSFEWEKAKVAHANKIIEQERRHRATERQWAESVTSIIDWHNRAKEGTENEYQGIVSDLESGNHRLRDDLRGCRAELSEASRSTGGDDGGGGGGLSESRQRVALRIGADADQVVHKLRACQSYVREALNATNPG